VETVAFTVAIANDEKVSTIMVGRNRSIAEPR
jgi:hypothetical protein